MPANASGLSIENLTVCYGAIRAVRDVSLEVEEGEIVALLGANGAGKSSILNACMGLVPITAGTIALQGHALATETTESIVRLGMTLTPEGRRVFSGLTVMENLQIGAAASKPLRRSAPAKIAEMLEMFPRLAERPHQLAGTLSGGEQQMLAIARSLMSRPRILLLDEPSLGLAPNIVDRIFDLIVTLRDQGLTILLVEQNVERSLNIADRAYVLTGGRLTMSGTPESLKAQGRLESAYLGGA
jgi:branched-chain amino acid transport system ATP-binding protein